MLKCQEFYICEQEQLHAQLSWAGKKFYNRGAWVYTVCIKQVSISPWKKNWDDKNINIIKIKPDSPKIMNGFIQYIRMENSTWRKWVNPLHTGRVFHCYMLDESICHFGGIRYFVAYILFWWKLLLANAVHPDQTPKLCGVWSGSALFVYTSFTGFQVRIG